MLVERLRAVRKESTRCSVFGEAALNRQSVRSNYGSSLFEHDVLRQQLHNAYIYRYRWKSLLRTTLLYALGLIIRALQQQRQW